MSECAAVARTRTAHLSGVDSPAYAQSSAVIGMTPPNRAKKITSLYETLPGTVRGALWMILATLLFAAMHGVIRALAKELHPFQIAFLRNVFGLLIFLPWFWRRGVSMLHTEQFGLHCIRAIIMSANMLAAFTAISLIPLSQIAALQMAMPLAITLGAIVFLGEKARLRRWTALGFGFCGALIIIRPGVQEISLGVWLMLLVVVLGSTGRLMAKRMTMRDSPVTISAYMNLLMTPMTLLPALWVWQTPQLWHLAVLIVIGMIGSGAQLALVQAYQATDMGSVEPITFLRLIWASLIGYVFFAEIPDLWTLIGGFIIFASATYIVRREAKLKRAPASP